jgi:hypothetical protein
MTLKKIIKIFQKNIIRLSFFFAIVAFLLTIFTVSTFSRLTYTVFPHKTIGNRTTAFNDKGFNGNSTVEDFSINKESMNLSYILREKTTYPMVWITINLSTDMGGFDLSAYDSVS